MDSNAAAYRVLSSSHGLAWLREGWALFKADIGIWIAIVIIWWLIDSVAGAIPLLGHATAIVDPVFAGGVIIGCDQVRRGGKLDIAHLFAGFDQRCFGALLTIGFVNLVADLLSDFLATATAMSLGAGALIHNVHINNVEDMQQLAQQIVPLLIAALPGIGAWIEVKLLFLGAMYLVLYFVAPLIVVGGNGAESAIRTSWAAMMANWLSLTMYSLWFLRAILLVLAPSLLLCLAAYFFGPIWLIVALPLMMLSLLLLAVPVTVVGITSTYAAYLDIFSERPTELSRPRGLHEPAR